MGGSVAHLRLHACVENGSPLGSMEPDAHLYPIDTVLHLQLVYESYYILLLFSRLMCSLRLSRRGFTGARQ